MEIFVTGLTLVCVVCWVFVMFLFSRTIYYSNEQVTTIIERLGLTIPDESRPVLAMLLSRHGASQNQAYLLLTMGMILIGGATFYSAQIPWNITSDNWHFLLIPRLSLLALVIFGVTLLLRLYRYQLRTAAFYRSRLDGFIIVHQMKKDPVELKDWMEAMYPPFDVGNQNHPMDSLTKILERAKQEQNTRTLPS